MRTHTSTRVLLWMSLAATLLLWPAEALAQRGRGGHGGGHSGGGSGRVVRSGGYYRPAYYRPYYYRPYFYSSFYWGTYGWYPYYPYWFAPYPYGGYYGGYYDNLGSVRTQVKPRQAQVYVDGYYAGLVDDYDGFSQRLRVKPGGHEVEIYLKGFRPIKETVYAQPGQTVSIKGELTPVAPGEAEPEPPKPTSPPPAQQDPNQYSRRRAPARAPSDPMPPVPQDEVSVAPPSSSSARSSSFGTLSIRVQPGNAVVLIDGEKWEGGDARDRLSIELSEGTHKVEVQKEGFTTYTTEVRVQRGQVTTLNVSLLSSREI